MRLNNVATWVTAVLLVAGVAHGCGEREPHPKTPSVTSNTVAAPASRTTTRPAAPPATEPAELPKAWFPVDRQGEQAMRAHQEFIQKQQDERREEVLRARLEHLQRRQEQKGRPPRPRPAASAPAP